MINYEYNLRGNKTYEGGATYPVRYTYDTFGNKTSMTTYRNEASGAGDATSWAYDEATGVLLSKTYADGKGLTYTYTDDGNLAARNTRVTNRDIISENPFRFSSEAHDDALALVYYNYRHYNPVDGRWIGRDIWEIGALKDCYIYGRNSPQMSFDRIGQKCIPVSGPVFASKGFRLTSFSFKQISVDFQTFVQGIDLIWSITVTYECCCKNLFGFSSNKEKTYELNKKVHYSEGFPILVRDSAAPPLIAQPPIPPFTISKGIGESIGGIISYIMPSLPFFTKDDIGTIRSAIEDSKPSDYNSLALPSAPCN